MCTIRYRLYYACNTCICIGFHDLEGRQNRCIYNYCHYTFLNEIILICINSYNALSSLYLKTITDCHSINAVALDVCMSALFMYMNTCLFQIMNVFSYAYMTPLGHCHIYKSKKHLFI